MTTVSKGTKTKRPLMGIPIRGPMHLWRTVDPDIPCQVASPQSLTPFLRAPSLYHALRPADKAPLDTVVMPQNPAAKPRLR